MILSTFYLFIYLFRFAIEHQYGQTNSALRGLKSSSQSRFVNCEAVNPLAGDTQTPEYLKVTLIFILISNNAIKLSFLSAA